MIENSSRKLKFSRFLVLFFLTLFLVCAFGIGYRVGLRQSSLSSVSPQEGRLVGQKSGAPVLEQDVDFKIFWNVWKEIKERYYQTPISDRELYYGSLKGLLSGLHDPYSVYFDPDEAKKFISDLNESCVGIGAQIGIKDEKLKVVAPLENSPAMKAGVLSGDWIVLIDQKETNGMSVEEAVSLIHGEEGTEVILQISRIGSSDLKEIKIKREKITIDSVKWKIEEGNIMHISISSFNGDTSDLFNKAVQEALTKNVKGIVLDLRGNPGGLLVTAVNIASAWVGYDPIVVEKSREKTNVFKGVTAPRLNGIKTVVLVDGGSASASEIVSGALQDGGYATLIGTKTFGKGVVQDYQDLPDGSALKITTAEWFTPKGRSIHKTGLEPDIKVDFDVEAFKKNSHDNQKQTARDVLNGTYKPPVERPVTDKK